MLVKAHFGRDQLSPFLTRLTHVPVLAVLAGHSRTVRQIPAGITAAEWRSDSY